MTRERLLLFDTASLYFRAFHGRRQRERAADGTPTHAVAGLLDFIAFFVERYSPTHLACCWDVDWRPGWRVALVPTYKTHRLANPADALFPPRALTPVRLARIRGWEVTDEEVPDELEAQVPLILESLITLGIPVVGADHYEADDVMATLARTSPVAADVVTGDRDLFQLVDDEHPIRVLYCGKGVSAHDVMDEAAVVAKYGVLPRQYADFALLRGDASDGLPGVPGIGEKSAQSLLQRHGDLEGVLLAASDPTSDLTPGTRRKLADGVEYLARARSVVQVADDIPSDVTLDELRLAPIPDPAAWQALRERLGVGNRITAVLPPA